QRGFTIIELMITLVILAVMVSLAGPSFTKLIRDSRVRTASNSLMAGFNTARAEAIRRGNSVSICAVNDPTDALPACNGAANGWGTGWVIFMDGDDDGAIDSGEVYRVGDPMSGVAVVGPAGGLVAFDSRGQPTIGTGSYVFDATSCDSGDKRITVELGTVGRVRPQGGVCP